MIYKRKPRIASVIEKTAEGSNIIKRNGNLPSQDNYVYRHLNHAQAVCMILLSGSIMADEEI